MAYEAFSLSLMEDCGHELNINDPNNVDKTRTDTRQSSGRKEDRAC